MRVRPGVEPVLIAACLLLATGALFLTAPTHGDFWWSDAPRHAMDGLFLRDLILAHPFRHPGAWAVAYYFRHPAITILFYPPLFPAVEAVLFLLFGASHACAQFAVACFTFVLAAASYGLARMMMPRLAALGCALLVIGVPETAFWGRQVMLDIPAYGLCVGAAVCLARYLRDERIGFLYLALLAFDAAIYTKYNAAILGPAFALAYVRHWPWKIWRDRRVMAALAVAGCALLPASVLFFKFGQINMQSVSGAGLLPGAPSGVLFYASVLPAQCGWLPLIVGLAGLMVLAWDACRPGGFIAVLLLAWCACTYAAFSLIALKSSRFDLMILCPLALAAGAALCRLLPGRIGPLAALALGAGVFANTLLLHPVPQVGGYADIARWLAARAPRNAVVLYDGYRDGNLVFDTMTIAGRPDIAIVRADKLLLSVPVGERATRGAGQRSLTSGQMADLLRRVGPDFVVVQHGFWADLPDMAAFESAVAAPTYRPAASFPITGQLSKQDGTQDVTIFQPATSPQRVGNGLSLDMPDIGRRFEGVVR
jgi:hypothetical protein